MSGIREEFVRGLKEGISKREKEDNEFNNGIGREFSLDEKGISDEVANYGKTLEKYSEILEEL